MISCESLTVAVYSMLAADPVLVSSGFAFQRGEILSSDPYACPIINVWGGSTTERPYESGGDRPWRGEADVLIYHQEADVSCGSALLTRLTLAAERIKTLVGSAYSFGSLAYGIVSVQWDLFDYQVKDSQAFLTGLTTVRYMVGG